MMFKKVDAHTLKCMIGEHEIIEMGFDMEDICRNQEHANEFMKQIIEKGNQAGYEISDNIVAVQATFLPNRQVVLSFTEYHANELLDKTLESLRRIFGRLGEAENEEDEELSNLKDAEEALEECKEEVAAFNEVSEAEATDTVKEQTTSSEQVVIPLKYVLEFRDFDTVEQFSKAAPSIPGKLYKQNGRYYLIADLTVAEDRIKKTFLLLANEFALSLKKEYLQAGFLEEHSDLLIKENPMEVLKNL